MDDDGNHGHGGKPVSRLYLYTFLYHRPIWLAFYFLFRLLTLQLTSPKEPFNISSGKTYLLT